jgi:outer membrane usher protein
VRKNDGHVVPMGADVFDARGQQVGVVGQSGMVFVRGVPDRGTLTVRADLGENGACSFEYERTNGNAGNATSCDDFTHFGLNDQPPREQPRNEARHATSKPTSIL